MFKKSILSITISSLLILFVLAAFTTDQQEETSVEKDLPTTGFEDREGERWTSLDEEIEFIRKIAELSERVWYEKVGHSVEGRPIYLVFVSDRARAAEEVKQGRTIFFMGTPHGDEPAPREGMFKLLRDLAFTDDPRLLEILKKATVLIMPTASPDSRAGDTRTNVQGINVNRDHLQLETPEAQTTARVLRDYQPDIFIDAHERKEKSPNIEYLWPRNLNLDKELYRLSRELVEDYLMPDAREAGWTTGLYGSPGDVGREDERILRNTAGLRHIITVLTESTRTASPGERVAMQLDSFYTALRFYHEKFDEIVQAVDGAPLRKQMDGKNKAEFYLDGADDEPERERIIDPPVCGYLLNTEQAEQIERHINLFALETEQIEEDAVFITMEQPMMTVIPFLVDERANYHEVEGLPVTDCTNLRALEPPDVP